MSDYYFLAPLLPPLVLGSKPELSFGELISALKVNVKGKDVEKAAAFRLYIDLKNIRFLFLEEGIEPTGNLTEKELDEALLLKSGLPEYVFDFLDRYPLLEDRLKNFSELIATFFREEIEQQTGFLKRYFMFEREWRLVLTALRAKEMKRDLLRELQFEDPKDFFVAHILAQKDMDQYDPPLEYIDLKEKYLSCGPDPWQQYKVITTWQFDRIRELVDAPLFSMEWILSYMARLQLVEEWANLEEQKGKMILEALVLVG